jgi:putative DNA primase/helicase
MGVGSSGDVTVSEFDEFHAEEFFKCGSCRKFHTAGCPAESLDSLKEKAYFQDVDSEPFDETCFELNSEALKEADLTELFTKIVLENCTFKHFVKGDSSLGLYRWWEGCYVECEEWLRSYIEKLGQKLGFQDRVKTHVVNEVVEKVKRLTFYELKDEPLKIAFKNCVLDWQAFLGGDLDKAVRPIEEAKEQPIFHLIPHRLDVDFLKECIGKFDVDNGILKAAEELQPNVVAIFKQWVGEGWLVLFEIVGYTLYPDYPFNKAFMLVGSGRNGKTTFLSLVLKVLGDGNVVNLSLQDICLYRFAMSELYHKLANVFSDLPSKPIGYTGLFKVLTGQDLVSAPRKFKDSIQFRNYAKLLFSANELPKVEDMTEAFWRRWIVLEFPNRFEDNPSFFEENFQEEVVEKIIVLSLLAFVNVYKNRGFTVEGSEVEFKEKWLRNSNSIYAYVKENLENGVLERSGDVDCVSLYGSYVEWCEENDIEAQTKNSFTRELERLFGVVKKRRREGGKLAYVYQGLRMREGEGALATENMEESDAVLTAENVQKVLSALSEAAKTRGTAYLSEIVEDAMLPEESVKAILEALQREGKVYSPYPEMWKIC